MRSMRWYTWLAVIAALTILTLYWLSLQPPVQSLVEEIITFQSGPFTTDMLPYYIGRTMLRMTAAYLLTLAFGLSYGITAGLREKASHVMIPILDVLQSVPVLGYLPPVIIFMTALLPGVLGQEVASVILIFTGMAWAVAFNVYGAVKNIPSTIVDVAREYNVSNRKYIKEVIFPAILPALVSGSILAWGGGWYFLIACEVFTYGQATTSLPGLGSYIWVATFSQPTNLAAAFFGLFIMAGIVALINQFVWHPLLDYSARFSTESAFATHYRRRRAISAKVSQTLLKELKDAARPLSAAPQWLGPVSNVIHTHPLPHPRLPRTRFAPPGIRTRTRLAIYLISAITFGVIVLILFTPVTGGSLSDILSALELRPQIYEIPYFAFRSVIRLGAGYLIALGWTLPVGIAVARGRRLSAIFLPIFDILQSVPALALFPIVATVLISAYGGLGVEVASVVLVLTGMQWYLLFNIIGSVKSIPPEIVESARAFGLKGTRLLKHVVLPAIFPGVIIGSIQAWGGGWNATIVSEYISIETAKGSVLYITPGLGSLLTSAAANGDALLVIIDNVAMAAVVLALNRAVWHSLMKRAAKYRLEI